MKSIDRHLESGGAVTKVALDTAMQRSRCTGDCEFRKAMDRDNDRTVSHHGKQLQGDGLEPRTGPARIVSSVDQ